MKLQLYTKDELYELGKAIINNVTGVVYPFNPRTIHRAIVKLVSLFGADISSQIIRSVNNTSLENVSGSLLERRGLEENTAIKEAAPARAMGKFVPTVSPAGAAYNAPSGTTVILPATATRSEIAFETEAAATIPLGGTESNQVSIICTQTGTIGNDIALGTNLDLKYQINGIGYFDLTSASGGGQNKQSDPSYRTSIREARKSLGESTWTGIEALLKTVSLSSGSKVVVARVFEDFVNDVSYAIIDDGSGDSTLVGPTDSTYDYAGYPGANYYEYTETSLNVQLQLPAYHLPYWNDGVDAAIQVDTGAGFVLQTYNTDYFVNLDTGVITFATPLDVGDVVRAWFDSYSGLVGLSAEFVNGIRGDVTKKGWRPIGRYLRIRGPYSVTKPSVSATLTFEPGFDSAFGRSLGADLVLNYLNSLNIGESARYNVINGILAKIPGVLYVSNLLLNSAVIDYAPTNIYGVVRGDSTTITI